MGITSEKCCNNINNCLISKTVSIDFAFNVMMECYEEVECLRRTEKKNYIRDKIAQTCIRGKSSSTYSQTGKFKYRYTWTIGRKDYIVVGVCKTRFLRAYTIGHTLLNVICNEIRRGVQQTLPSICDNLQVLHSEVGTFQKLIIGMCQDHNINLSREQIAQMNLPNCTVVFQHLMKFDPPLCSSLVEYP